MSFTPTAARPVLFPEKLSLIDPARTPVDLLICNPSPRQQDENRVSPVTPARGTVLKLGQFQANWDNWSPSVLNNLPKVTRLASGRAWPQSQVVWL